MKLVHACGGITGRQRHQCYITVMFKIIGLSESCHMESEDYSNNNGALHSL